MELQLLAQLKHRMVFVSKNIQFRHKLIWFSGYIPRVSFITWLVILNRLATKDKVMKWNSIQSTSCEFCETIDETRDFLLFGYKEHLGRFFKDVAGHLKSYERLR